MNIPTKKLLSGFEMPVYGLGTWQMGEDESQKDADVSAVKDAIELGITHIDTAEVYGDGGAEKVVGDAIKGYDRKKLFIVSKVYGNHLHYNDLLNSLNKSLDRLGTDYLDLFLLHRFNPEVELSETMRAMEDAFEQKLIKNIGISNYNVDETQSARKNCKYPVVANQLHYNLKIREAQEKGLLDYCQKEDLMLIAWRPLKHVDLDLPIVANMAKKYNKTPVQIALNWLISQKNVVTLSKTANVIHLKENLGALDFTMEQEDIKSLLNDFPDQEEVSDTVALRN